MSDDIVVTAPKHHSINAVGLALVKSFEGLRLKAYPDPATNGDPWTIGYGSTGPHVHPGLVLTEPQCEELLVNDLWRFEQAVTRLTAGHGTDNQFAALVSFAFNVGADNLRTSTLLRKHNEGDYAGAQKQFWRWNKAAGRVMAGLTRRREAESALYGSGA